MANRYIPFGYEITEGKLTIIEKEREIIENIFAMYINKMSFMEIATRMNDGGVSYNNDGRSWNKNIVKRILENEKYLGKDGYPQIISEITFENVKTLRDAKTTPSSAYDKELNDLYRGLLVCSKCGKPLKRYNGPIRNGKRTDYYKCFNEECKDEGITINKLKLNMMVTEILNEMIRGYEPPKQDAASKHTDTEEEKALNDEIENDVRESILPPSEIFKKLYRLAAMRFNSCSDECMDAINENIKRELSIRAEKNMVDTKLLKYLAKKIILNKDRTIRMELINGDTREGGVPDGCECSI